MADTFVPLRLDQAQMTADLERLPSTAAVELGRLLRLVEQHGGIPVSRLRRCDPEGRDGTRLPNCLKVYVPEGENKWGLVAVVVAHPERPFGLRVLAYGIRHPTGTTPSVYQLAHRRLHAAGPAS
ncbi:hypothetical protein GKE82_26005 [Conexibacter sp. W3-3-2]|uniref:hypothetical protein n=1 Tax=Conexibacter sp. W3-3-2 TaxID=2675227 RepID=UPI0012BA0CDB|nr:hypothetical protein [Conexibacter sp. W3-3-2]MTD47659.1 hypothetical protein [Conexibacter sp. W3-3-2]